MVNDKMVNLFVPLRNVTRRMGFRCFLEGVARVFVRWSADFQSGGLAIKARCKLACKRDLRDYTQGRVGRPPRFRLTKKKFIYHL